ncbi:Vsp/OspC family lipoprotein (plasmid) [Borrelia miyamotoi]|uniref:Vsp/OspC family lipoprotein n=2 Tax=Borrelia miyamotoi TaxID=47466 RepID=A0AAQ3CMS0_9SPIR|nr:Vsp/OspC family lipoprotein [Borrelia miyamotoi]ATQ15372.2 Vsp/OspC family lipoprotein [Borrelia miyamotoi]ATQ21563.2 Vsp/OspC family lipoprotein [Borrelia miyamotoi]WAZ71292.1 Vsp/OspC family lipoprotein [Borrelia miyamotoi]WCL22217.1 Vsp/OspC family lipoprotein [Borrelia miyamotoi]WDE70482.1 Vsp/OspC family lipoprotein [Borrelia miyamotoi]
MRKRKKVSAIIMTLFLIINIVMMSCGSGGPAPKEGQAAKADGTVIDLAKVSKKIKYAVEFAASVKEIETLVKSVDELAKAIGKKIKNDNSNFEAEKDHNGALIAGAFQVILTVKGKLTSLEQIFGISDELKTKVGMAKKESEAFLTQVKSKHTDLAKEGVTDAHAKSVIDVADGTKDKGASELVKLNTEIDELLKAAKMTVDAAIAELTNPVKVAATGDQSGIR